ncbi:winged helix DNA-binding domain-containing protein [Agromyces protaetiae]|uniref:Winged helix DNA-binding domain-containing protein n=1 Tax=Agromyces protaetiae TaxID=2509455 RepID=A0A4P6FA51_9MICO|nr:winged helix DNA-binding domain-containing protein [Agromyces protaetiae]QAY72456.1 winged helix DNA-binding domain-containing protein [Agromyces protaetiae]
MEFDELRSRRLFAHGLRGPVTAGGADVSKKADVAVSDVAVSDVSGPDAPGRVPSGPASSPAELVRRAVAVQSQEYLPAQWGLAQRLPIEQRPDATSVNSALDRGEILRTHVLRPTWHFLHPADARWVIGLSAERVHRQNGGMYRRGGIEGDLAVRGLDVIATTVAERHSTRPELHAALEASGIALSGLELGLLVMYAELERVIVSGASAGKQRTYAPFDERVPAAPERDRGDALAELAERFLLTRSPATPRDFATWSGFTVGDARQAFADARDRSGGRIEPLRASPGNGADADALWHDASVSAEWTTRRTDADAGTTGAGGGRVDLLQAYDEYIMGYGAPRAFLQSPLHARNPIVSEFPLHALMIDGAMAGRWAHTVQARRASVRIVPWRRFTAAEARSRDAAIAEVARFLGVPVTVEIERVSRA